MNLMAKLARGANARLGSRRGLAAMEFALTSPIWVLFLLGTSDGVYCMIVNERTDRIAYTVTDIVTQYQSISLANLNDIVLAAGQLMNPITFGGNGIVIVTSVYQPAGQKPKICWQYTGGGTLSSQASRIGQWNGASNCSNGTLATLPNGLTLNDNDNIIVSEVYYNYTPLFSYSNLFPANVVYREAVYKPRLSLLITPPT
jgi:hypothetical protein